LGETFAKHCESTYLKTFDEVAEVIEKANEKTIIVVYSAGDIDYQLRQYLKIVS
jgi:UDP-N-acetylmuramate-alanine ligase